MPNTNYDTVFFYYWEHFQNELIDYYKFGEKRYTEESLLSKNEIPPLCPLERTRLELLKIMKNSKKEAEYKIWMQIALYKAQLRLLEKESFKGVINLDQIIDVCQKLQKNYEELATQYGFVSRKNETVFLTTAAHYQEKLTLFQKTADNHRKLAEIYKNLAEINEHEKLASQSTTIDYLKKAANNLEQAAISEKKPNKKGEFFAEAARSYHELSIIYYDRKNLGKQRKSRELFQHAEFLADPEKKSKLPKPDKKSPRLIRMLKPKHAIQGIDSYFRGVKYSFSRRFKPFNLFKFSPIFYHELDFNRFLDNIIAFHRQANLNAGNHSAQNALKHYREALIRKFSRMPCQKLQNLHKKFGCVQCHELMEGLGWAINNSEDQKLTQNAPADLIIYSRLSNLIEEAKSHLECKMCSRNLRYKAIIYPATADCSCVMTMREPSERVLNVIQDKAKAIREHRLVLVDPTYEETQNIKMTFPRSLAASKA